MRAVKIVFGILCLGFGVALALSALNELAHPSYFHQGSDVWIPGMFAAMFLMGSYLLFR